MEFIGKTLLFAGKLILFLAITIIFIPSFLIVNFLQEPWNKMMGDLFKL